MLYLQLIYHQVIWIRGGKDLATFVKTKGWSEQRLDAVIASNLNQDTHYLPNLQGRGMTAIVSLQSEQDLQQLLESKPRVIIGFYAKWSRGSQEVISTVTSQLVASHYDDLAIGTLDVGVYEDFAFEQGVSFLSYFAFYRNNRRFAGETLTEVKDALEACRHFATSMDEDYNDEEAASLSSPSAPKVKASVEQKKFYVVDRITPGKPLLLFIAGDRSKVGKSSVCLGLLGSLLNLGFKPQDLAYIKPATQCESPQLVTKWCDSLGIANRGIGPVVFYKGFTREFLKGSIGSSKDLLQDIRQSVEEIGQRKKVVLIDGVGYPAVGSICGVSNADIAEELKCPIIIVGRPGVGDAVDSFNLNACFFRYRGLKVLGVIFNRLPLEGFYSLEACQEAVVQYFTRFQPETRPYGFLPELPQLLTVREEIDAEHASKAELEAAKEAQRLETARLLIDTFTNYVDLSALVQDAYNYSTSVASPGISSPIPSAVAAAGSPPLSNTSSSSTTPTTAPIASPVMNGGGNGGGKGEGGGGAAATTSASSCVYVPRKRKSREEIEAAAKEQGAKAGG